VARLALGPLLRYVSETAATVWVETDAPAEVEVLGRRARTFRIGDRHYALVAVEGLEPGSTTEYGVALDGEAVWPESGAPYPPSLIRTPATGRRLRLVAASCRTAAPHHPPFTLSPNEADDGRELDALRAYALRARSLPADELPDLLLLLGDQIYADELAPEARAAIRARRDTTQPPGHAARDVEEYALVYDETWRDPDVRWLQSTVGSAMLFDDHEICDDWNTSQAWVDERAGEPWWQEQLASGLAAYWIYQHLGNLSPAELDSDELLGRVRDSGDGLRVLKEAVGGLRWSYARELPGTRIVVLDSRTKRRLSPPRELVDDEEWGWLEREARGGVDHVVLASSLPWLLPRGAHFVEAWSEAVCDGAWGRLGRALGELARRRFDLEHWPAFSRSFDRLGPLVEEIAAGERGDRPAQVLVLGGDVHYTYLAALECAGAPVHQLTCSPLRNPLIRADRNAALLASSPLGALIGRGLARTAGVGEPQLRWRVEHGPWFDNVIATVDLAGRDAQVRVEHTGAGTHEDPRLETLFEHSLA
jgi:hypothetical protein